MKLSSPIARRDFLQFTLAGAGFLLLPRWTYAADEPHFFLQIIFPSGWDPTYLFDARPLAMTQAGMIQNYLGEEPTLLAGDNGGTCLRTSLTNDLISKYRTRFSILNGVHMANGFDGHDQNMNELLTGSPFGGESFIPHLNQLAAAPLKATPLDALQAGFLFSNLTNSGSTVPLNAASARTLIENLQKLPAMSTADPVSAFIRKRYALGALGAGRFSSGCRNLLQGYEGAPPLADMIKNMTVPPVPTPGPSATPQPNADTDSFITLAQEAFRRGISRSAVISVSSNDFFLDTHGADQAKQQPKFYAAVASAILGIFKALDAPFDSKSSFWDVTTVMITSEFSRSMRQLGVAIDKTGTDHNPLTNTVLFGGRGIRGGMVMGASDQTSVTDPISKAHQIKDQKSLKLMGKPFDFTQGAALNALPQDFHVSDYLTVHSVANTIYSLFGVPAEHYRLVERNGAVAPTLKTLLT